MEDLLEAARAKVNELEFGTPEWDAAMEVVCKLVAEDTTETEYTSIDGDVWSV